MNNGLTQRLFERGRVISQSRYWHFLSAHPYMVASVLSVLVSLIVFSHQQPPAVDAFLYLKVARAYLDGGYKAALHIFPWPFYSILIAYVHQISGLSFLYSAYALNMVLSVGVVIGFMVLSQEIYQHRRFLWLGLLVALNMQCYNHVRDDIIRGHGYWSMSLLALACLLCLVRTRRYYYGVAWGILMMVATLFRIEGAVLLMLVPLGILFLHDRFLQKLKLLISAYSLLLLATVALLACGIYFNKLYLGRITELLKRLFHPVISFVNPFYSAVDAMQQHVLHPIAAPSAPILLAGGVVILVAFFFIKKLTIVYTLFGGYGISTGAIEKSSARTILFWALLINVVICLLFTFRHFFISPRYLFLLFWIYALWIPGVVWKIYQSWRVREDSFAGKPWLFPLICLGFLYLAIAGLGHFGPSQAYITQAEQWLEQRQKPNALLITNDHTLAGFYEQQGKVKLFNFDYDQDFSNQLIAVRRSSRGKLVYFAFSISRRHSEQTDHMKKIFKNEKFREFHNARGDKVMIFFKN